MAKILIISTNAKNDPEKSTIPWVVGNAALVFDHEVQVFLQGQAVNMVRKGYLDGFQFAPFDPVAKLIDSFREQGGKIYVCVPCMKAHSLDEDDLLPECEPASAGHLVQEALDATVFSY